MQWLKGDRFAQLSEALIDAYRSQDELFSFARTKLNYQLERQTSKEKGLVAVAEALLEWAEAEDRVAELVEKAQEDTLNPQLKQVAAEFDADWFSNMPRLTDVARYLRQTIEEAEQSWAGQQYVEMAGSAQMIEQPIVKARSERVRRVLERQHRAFKDPRRGQKDNPSQSQEINSFAALYAYVCSTRHVALIGDPGSGKTTTLRQLQRKMAQEALEEPEALLPLFLQLSTVKNASFDGVIAAQLSTYGLTPTDYPLNRIFLLLDGLNEMPYEQGLRLAAWLKNHPDVSVVITCRKLDYFNFQLPLNRIDIEPLDVTRIYEFLERYLEDEDAADLFWQLAGKETATSWTWWQDKWLWRGQSGLTEQDGDVFTQFWYGYIDKANAWNVEKFHLKQVQDRLRSEKQLPGLLGIATNPFFLMVIVDIYAFEGNVPHNRGQLIAGFADLLLTRTAETKAPLSLIATPVDPHPNALAIIAYRMQAERTGTVADIAWTVNTLVRELPDLDIDHLLSRSVSSQILDVVPGKTLRFTHQLLQEYFAGVKLGEAIRRGAKAEEYWPSKKWWVQTGWEESVVLLAGLMEDATSIVEWLRPVQPTLAFRCAMESGARCDPETLQSLYEPPAGARVSPEARFAWGKLMAAQGDTRIGVGLDANALPDIDWCLVPEGKFLFGRWETETSIPAFRIARYPITNAQFQAFIEAPDGYDNPEWWQDLPVSISSPAYPAFAFANHPRENVNWYEAIAYCNWLSHTLGLQITLPTEMQWEKAARGTDGYVWPWGDEYIVGYANVDERDEHNPVGSTYLRSTTAVGLYPWGKSPYGVMDMCGNVWEWCLNDADDPYGMEMGSPASEKQLRGGSWNNNIDVAPTYHRYTLWVRHPLRPTYRNWRVGFRVVALD